MTKLKHEELAKTLTHQQLLFVDLVLKGVPKDEAYRDAGLSENGEPNSSKATWLLKSPRIAAYIDAMNRGVAQRSVCRLEVLDQILSDIAMAQLSDMTTIEEKIGISDEGNEYSYDSLKINTDLTEAQKNAIESIKVTDKGKEIKLFSKLKAVDMLIKRREGYNDTVKHEHEVKKGPMVVIMPGNNNRGPKTDGE